MEIVALDTVTLGNDVNLEILYKTGHFTCYDNTAPWEVPERIKNADIVIINKVRLTKENLTDAKNLKLICITATGYDNIDTKWCKEHGIGVSNAVNYSTESVCQVTLSIVLSLWNHLSEYSEYTSSGEFSKSGIVNKLTPQFSEISGKTWGIIGCGNIGKRMSEIAAALGCNVVKYDKITNASENYLSLEKLCEVSDIITIHLPHNSETYHIINGEMLSKMKKNCILVNTARGAVTDEEAVAKAISEGNLKAFGCDVYSEEPFSKDHPFYKIKDYKNVLLTPHIGWAAVDSRQRVIEEMYLNIVSFEKGGMRNRIV